MAFLELSRSHQSFTPPENATESFLWINEAEKECTQCMTVPASMEPFSQTTVSIIG